MDNNTLTSINISVDTKRGLTNISKECIYNNLMRPYQNKTCGYIHVYFVITTEILAQAHKEKKCVSCAYACAYLTPAPTQFFYA